MAMSFAGAVVRGFHGQPTASRYGSSRTVAMSLDMSKSYRRAEPWKPGTATLEEVINVIGRWESSSEWKERTEFREDVIENLPLFFEDPAQGYTLQRYEMAQRMGMVERVAFLQNVAKLPFTNAALARSVGKTIEDFQDAPVANAAANIVRPYSKVTRLTSSIITDSPSSTIRSAGFRRARSKQIWALASGRCRREKSRVAQVGWILRARCLFWRTLTSAGSGGLVDSDPLHRHSRLCPRLDREGCQVDPVV